MRRESDERVRRMTTVSTDYRFHWEEVITSKNNNLRHETFKKLPNRRSPNGEQQKTMSDSELPHAVQDERNSLAIRILIREDPDLMAQVNSFSREMAAKLGRKLADGRKGWSIEDDPDWTVDQIKKDLTSHIELGDPVDVANYALFWWSMENRTKKESQ